MRILLFLFLMSCSFGVAAQKKPAYTACAEIGWLAGNNGRGSAVFISNGVRYKNLSAGIGLGVDDYVFRSVPLFADIKKDFGHRRFQPFVEGSAGLNMPAVKDYQKQYTDWQYNDPKFQNGMFGRLGAGVSLQVTSVSRVYISGGYSYKTINVRHNDYSPDPGNAKIFNTDTYRLNRWYLAAGLRL